MSNMPFLMVVFGAAIWCTGTAEAQVVDIMRAQIDKCKSAADALKVHAWICAMFAFMIAALSVLLAGLDRSTQLRKWLAGGLSAIIASLTFVTSTMYPESAKGLFDTCGKGYDVVEKAEQHVNQLELHQLDAADVGADREAFMQTMAGCMEIRRKRAILENPWFSSLPGAKSAHASEPEGVAPGPKWIRGGVPEDSLVMYFIGTAHDATLRTAQAEAISNARQQIEQYVVARVSKALGNAQAPEGGYQAARRLALAAASAGVADTYWRYSEQVQLYDYNVLLRLQRSEIEQVVALWLSSEGAEAAERAGKLVSRAPGPSPDYQLRRQEKYAEVLDRTRKDLSPELYLEFLRVREDRKRQERDSGETIAALEAIVRKQPELYLGWFNLAIAYQDAQRDDKADHAFAKALALEESQQLNDPSIASTYGVFLYRQGRYPEAVKMMDRALATEPDHPYAQYYRRLAARKIPERSNAGMVGDNRTDNDSSVFR